VLVDVQVPLSESVRSSLLGDDGAGKASQDSLSEARDEVRLELESQSMRFHLNAAQHNGCGLPRGVTFDGPLKLRLANASLCPQAFRYLSSEVLPHFVRSQSPLGLQACLYSTKRVIWTLEDAARKASQSFAA
jgi:hypothetical protein